MKRVIKVGSVDQTIDIFLQDNTSTTGAGRASLVFGDVTCYYRKGATGTPTALSLITQTVGGAHADGGFIAVDNTNCPGQYRLDLSDTIVAALGAVTLYIKGAAIAPSLVELHVVAYDPLDGVRLGLTALPNAAANAAGGLPITTAGAVTMDSIKTDTAATLAAVDTEVGGVTTGITTILSRLPAALTVDGNMKSDVLKIEGTAPQDAADVADAVWEEPIGDHDDTAGSTAEQLAAAGAAGDPWSTALPGSYTAGQAGKIIGDNINAAMTTRATQTSADTIIAAVVPGVANILAKTNLIPTDPADASDIAASFTSISSQLSSVNALIDTEVAAILAAVDTEVAAIKAKTDLITGAPAVVGSAMTLTTGERDAIAQAHLNLDDGIDVDWSPKRVQKTLAAALAGKVSISGNTVTIRDVRDLLNAITATTDVNGQRTDVTHGVPI